MYLKKSPTRNGRVYLSIVEGHYDPQKKQSRTVTVQKLGYLDDLSKEHSDPIAHYTTIVAEMNQARIRRSQICPPNQL